ncbi:MAG TPA: hypothetical protein VMX94_05975 [Armatimonadota bacterium]|nr:hypothetical protein [Armatimonadota bacterium]
MARILVDGEWYEEIALASLYESDLEQIVLAQAASLYPGYYTIPFKTLVCSDDGSARPDFALIDNEYAEWWVVEVEMAQHNLAGHVLPQVRTLAQAVYGQEQAQYLCAKCPDLAAAAVLDMMKGRQPRVLVVINTPRPEWAKALEQYGAGLAVFEVFRSEKNHHIFRVNGEQPRRLAGVVSLCSLDPLMPRLLKVDSPACLGVEPNTRVLIRYRNQVCEWERMDSQTDVWLSPVASNPLTRRVRYELVRLMDGSLEIQKHAS